MNVLLISQMVQSCGTVMVMVMVVGVSVREQFHREYIYIYKVIRNDCRGFDNLSYTIHLR